MLLPNLQINKNEVFHMKAATLDDLHTLFSEGDQDSCEPQYCQQTTLIFRQYCLKLGRDHVLLII